MLPLITTISGGVSERSDGDPDDMGAKDLSVGAAGWRALEGPQRAVGAGVGDTQAQESAQILPLGDLRKSLRSILQREERLKAMIADADLPAAREHFIVGSATLWAVMAGIVGPTVIRMGLEATSGAEVSSPLAWKAASFLGALVLGAAAWAVTKWKLGEHKGEMKRKMPEMVAETAGLVEEKTAVVAQLAAYPVKSLTRLERKLVGGLQSRC